MKDYKIILVPGRTATMVIVNRQTGEEIAEYALTAGGEQREIRAMRRVIDRHISAGGTLGNYQW